MKKKIIVIFLLIVVLLVGGIFTWKLTQNGEQKKNSPSQQRDNDTPTSEDNPPPENPNGKLSPAELEKYLLEKRLDLQKYFVFNLGKEVKTRTTEKYNNLRYVSGDLASDMAKLAIHYKKKPKRKE